MAYFALRFRVDFLRKFLPQIIPLLLLKKRQAQIVLWFLNHPVKAGLPGMNDEQVTRRLKLREECIYLNMCPQKRERLGIS